MIGITWERFRFDCKVLARNIVHHCNGIRPSAVYGVPTGGCFVALELSHIWDVPIVYDPLELVVDDLVDSGKTLEEYPGYLRAGLYRKVHSPPLDGVASVSTFNSWIQFPWEHGGAPEDAVIRLLEFIGEDPSRQGLRDTPARVCKALREMTSGYDLEPIEILSKTFDDAHDELIIVRGIPFTSLCEHHLLTFSGTADIGYIPAEGDGIVGLSKLARLVDCFARRLQVQERLTRQIAAAITDCLSPRGVAVVIRAEHSCMACRGVRKPGTECVTSSMAGAFRDKPAARAEFLKLCE